MNYMTVIDIPECDRNERKATECSKRVCKEYVKRYYHSAVV